jgi:hypothetical protein
MQNAYNPKPNYLSNKFRQDEMGGAFSLCGVVKPEKTRPLIKPELRFGYNIKMYIKRIGCEGV